jgi:hypothetical protein
MSDIENCQHQQQQQRTAARAPVGTIVQKYAIHRAPRRLSCVAHDRTLSVVRRIRPHAASRRVRPPQRSSPEPTAEPRNNPAPHCAHGRLRAHGRLQARARTLPLLETISSHEAKATICSSASGETEESASTGLGE